jgi:hypothetical protein
MRSIRVSLFLLASCTDGSPHLQQVSSSSEVTNGASLNGASLNGASLNGASLNGASLNGASLNGASLNGASLDGVALVGSSFEADGVDDLVGAIFVGTLSDGRSINLRIDDIAGHDDVALHTISVQVDQGWVPLCEDADGNNLPAIALAGQWTGDGSKNRAPGFFTFACRGGALAKCVENLGYKPWLSSAHDSLHQTCTRTIRADYCGDGRSWTVNGRAINVYDDQGIQDDTEYWGKEAEWNESGARCLLRQRVLDLGAGLPPCILVKANLFCGYFPDWDRTLIVNEAYDLGLEL